jgi:hypothetical protein
VKKTMPSIVRWPAAVAAALLLSVAAASSVHAQSAPRSAAPRSFAWFGELVSVQPPHVTVKVGVEPHVAQSLTEFQPGAAIVLVWSQFQGEGDSVRYLDVDAAVPADLGGYVVRGRMVAADPSSRSLTLEIPAPASVLRVLGTATAGTAIKLTSSTLPAGASVSAIALNARPKPRPIVQKPVLAASTVQAAAVAGKWAIETELMGNKLKLACDLSQDAARLTGTCSAPQPLGTMELTSGSVNGTAVAFQFDITGFGVPLVFLLKGEVDAAGSAMKGGVSVSGFDAPFNGARQ